jgi:hypothetical protein
MVKLMKAKDSTTTRYKLRFGGKNELDASTLGEVLLNTVALTEEANKVLGNYHPLNINVKSHKKGSFIVDLAFQVPEAIDAIVPLITPDNLKTAKLAIESIVGLVASVLSLRKKLKNEAPKEIDIDGDNVTLTTGNNNKVTTTINTYKLYFDNARGQKSVQDILNAVEGNKSVEDFSLLDDKDEPLFEVNRKELPQLIAPISIESDTQRSKTVRVLLNILALDWQVTKNKWRFIFQGNKILAKIEDPEFANKVKNGERFANGDALEVDLEIEQEFDKSVNTFLNKRYKVLKVIRHIPREIQPPLITE